MKEATVCLKKPGKPRASRRLRRPLAARFQIEVPAHLVREFRIPSPSRCESRVIWCQRASSIAPAVPLFAGRR